MVTGPAPETLVICADDRASAERCLRASVKPRQRELPAVLFLTPLTVAETARLADICHKLLRPPALFGALMGPRSAVGTPNAVLRYSGDMDAYERLLPVLRVLGPVTYAGESPVLSALLDTVATGVHHATLMALLTGMGMSSKYSFDLGLYARRVGEGVPALSQGAYRSIWSGLSDERTFEHVDDDIHAMEMLVCRLKTSGSAPEVEENAHRQQMLNRMIWDYWRSVEERMLRGGGRDV